MLSEKALQVFFIKSCRQAGLLAYKMVCVGRRGFPDVLVIDQRGASYYIELKAPSGKGVISAQQTKVINELKEQKANVQIIYSKQQAVDFIRSIG